jgi:anti-sigma regulatory factor (Ser/Thr protein kinase)
MDPLTSARHGLHTLRVPEDVGAMRRRVRDLALSLGASEATCGRAELATTELCSNVLHHAQAPGHLLLLPMVAPHGRGLEIVAVDRGRGIADLATALEGTSGRESAERVREAGSSRARGLGCGLSSVRRLASEFDIHSAVGLGTVVLARFHFEPPTSTAPLRFGALSLPAPGELENGDGWAIAQHASDCTVLLVDGLGHGPLAARAAAAALGEFRCERHGSLESYVHSAHQALRATRGAALSVCRIQADRERMEFVGLGNVEGKLHHRDGSTALTPRNGTVGMNLQPPSVHVRELPWKAGSMLILHSDGLRRPADGHELDRLWARDPSTIAAALHRDFCRGRDDATVLVVRDARAATS